MKVKLLRKIQKLIAAKPLRFNIDHWVMTDDEVAPCKTTACIAGFAVAASMKGKSWRRAGKAMRLIESEDNGFPIRDKAQKLLGLTDDEAKSLFYSHRWPTPYATRHTVLTNVMLEALGEGLPREAAFLRRKLTQVAIDRIEHFIQCHE